jgi:hypothetical protein
MPITSYSLEKVFWLWGNFLSAEEKVFGQRKFLLAEGKGLSSAILSEMKARWVWLYE